MKHKLMVQRLKTPQKSLVALTQMLTIIFGGHNDYILEAYSTKS